MSREIDEIFWDGLNEEPLGAVWAAVRNQELIAVRIGGDADGFRQMLSIQYGGRPTRSKEPVTTVLQQIEAYLRGERKTFEIPIHWTVMTPFQEKVLQAVYAIPYGETRSYGQIGEQIGILHPRHYALV